MMLFRSSNIAIIEQCRYFFQVPTNKISAMQCLFGTQINKQNLSLLTGFNTIYW